jgi:flagellar P-ring protein precursor FlgI
MISRLTNSKTRRGRDYISSALYLAALISILIASYNAQAVRLKDVVEVQGVRENILIGYGLVVGLNGTGDTAASFTTRSLTRMLDKFGVPLQGQEVASQNVAAVVVTAKLPAFARQGSKIDVHVSSVGDSTSLEGGTLVSTPLKAGDQKVYAVAQGQVSSGGLESEGVATLGRIPSGALIEKEVNQPSFTNKKGFRLALNQADFTTAARVAKSINIKLGGKFATAKDARTVDVVVPFGFEGNAVELMAIIEPIEIEIDGRAKVVINEKTGTVVAGSHVTIETVALSHGDLTIEVGEAEAEETNQEGGAAQRELAAAGGDDDEDNQASVHVMEQNGNVGDLAKMLNALGVKPKDLIGIFQALKAAGALRAELEVM